MKKIMVCALLLVIATASFSQQTTREIPAIENAYLLKSKKQKKTGWILLGGGLVCSVTGCVILARSAPDLFVSTFSGEESSLLASLGDDLIYLGVTSILTSIPLFTASAKNKKKVRSLSFKNESAPQMRNSSFVYKPVPSLTLKISL